MAKVKIYLDKDETIEDAEMQLRKALDLHDSGDIHDRQDYVDPAMQDIMDRFEAMHEQMSQEMMEEILQAVDKEYDNGY